MYNFLTENEHMITVRNRDDSPARKFRYWNENVIRKILNNQKPTEDVFVTKYPSGRLIKYLILDFDSKENKNISLKESKRMLNFFENEGHPCVLVDSTNKGYHLYIKISPFLFRDEGNRVANWKLFFEEFVRFMLNSSSRLPYTSLDDINTSAGMGGNIRLIGSIHPSTGKRVSIIQGEFNDDVLPPTPLQDFAQIVAYNYCEECEKTTQKSATKTKVVWSVDPCKENDLREIFPAIFHEDVKEYSDYVMMCCPFHQEKHESLRIGKEWYKCYACGEKGNIWTLKKKGLVEFGLNGEVVY